jgi:predicted nucleic acid-binding protein
MKVLDATFAIDYEYGIKATERYLTDHADEAFIMPAPTFLEVLLGEVHYEGITTDLIAAREELGWADIKPVTEETATQAAQVADEIGSQGPQLTMPDAVVAGTARELGAPVVSYDSDLTHDEIKKVVDVEEYR